MIGIVWRVREGVPQMSLSYIYFFAYFAVNDEPWQFRSTLLLISRITGMYGPPQRCKRKTSNGKVVCANVFGLEWSRRLRAMMDVRSLSSL